MHCIRSIEEFHFPSEITWDEAYERAQKWASEVHQALSPDHSWLFNEYYGVTITFCPRVYEFSKPIRLGAAMKLQGAGSFYGTILYFPNSDGIIAEFDVTDLEGDGKKPIGQDSILENLLIVGGYAGTIESGTSDRFDHTEYDGIKAKTNITIRDCYIRNFSRDGINIETTLITPDDPATLNNEAKYNNANVWQLNNVKISGCGRHGLYTKGNDANAGTAMALTVFSNGWSNLRPLAKDLPFGRYAIFDESFLGNNYFGCHAEGCVVSDTTLQEARIRESNELTDFESGGYRVLGGSNYSTFVGCYSELDSPCKIHYPAIWVGRGVLNHINGQNPPVFLSANGFHDQIGVQTFKMTEAEKQQVAELDARLYNEGTAAFSEEIIAGKGMSLYLGRDFDHLLTMAPMQQRIRYEKTPDARPSKTPVYSNFQGEPGFALSYDFEGKRRYDFGMVRTNPILSFKKDPQNDDKLYFPRGFHLGFHGGHEQCVKVISWSSPPEPPVWNEEIYPWKLGDVTLNSAPSEASPYAGWIYTAAGWKPYGKIEF